ncbi:MAG: hypothetical protein ACLSVD_09485 [Eggerthellaceae bacterium]
MSATLFMALMQLSTPTSPLASSRFVLGSRRRILASCRVGALHRPLQTARGVPHVLHLLRGHHHRVRHLSPSSAESRPCAA